MSTWDPSCRHEVPSVIIKQAGTCLQHTPNGSGGAAVALGVPKAREAGHACSAWWTSSTEGSQGDQVIRPPHSPAGTLGTSLHSAGPDKSGRSQTNCFHTQPRHPQPAKSAILNWNYLQMHWVSFSLLLVSSRSYGLDSKKIKSWGLFGWLDLFSLDKTNSEIKSISKLSIYSWEE